MLEVDFERLQQVLPFMFLAILILPLVLFGHIVDTVDPLQMDTRREST